MLAVAENVLKWSDVLLKMSFHGFNISWI